MPRKSRASSPEHYCQSNYGRSTCVGSDIFGEGAWWLGMLPDDALESLMEWQGLTKAQKEARMKESDKNYKMSEVIRKRVSAGRVAARKRLSRGINE